MRTERKRWARRGLALVGVAAVAAALVGTVLRAPVAGGVSIGMTCEGADQNSKTILGVLAPDTGGTFGIPVDVTSTAPVTVGPSQTFDASFTWLLELPPDLVEAATAVGITSANVSGLTLPVSVSGAGSGPDVVGTPPPQGVDFADPAIPGGTYTGAFTATGAVGETISFVAGAVTMTAEVVFGSPISLNLACVPDAGAPPVASVTIAAGNVAVDPASDVAPSSTVTVSGTAIQAGDAPFTGDVELAQCGNGDASVAKLPGPVDVSLCDPIGAATNVAASVTDGALAPTQFTIRETGIGAEGLTCIAGGDVPCAIVIRDVETGGEAVTLFASYTLPDDTPPPRPPVETPPSSTPTEVGGAATGGGTAVGAATTVAEDGTTAPGELPKTGGGRSTWVLLAVGIALVDAGYLAWSATRARRRWSV